MKILIILSILALGSCVKDPIEPIEGNPIEVTFEAESNSEDFMIIWNDDKARGVYLDQSLYFSETIQSRDNSVLSIDFHSGEIGDWAILRIYVDGVLTTESYCFDQITNKFYCKTKINLNE